MQSASAQTDSNASVQKLVEEALEANPELIVMRREFDSARARISQAAALPDPVIGIGNINVGTPIPFFKTEDGFNENFYFSFTQDPPWFGVRRLRGLTASAEAEAKFQEYLSAKRRLAAEVKSAAYDLYYIDRSLAVIKRDIEILENIAKAAEARYAAGKAQQADVINARLEIAELTDKQGGLESDRLTVAARINNLLYRDPEAEISPHGKAGRPISLKRRSHTPLRRGLSPLLKSKSFAANLSSESLSSMRSSKTEPIYIGRAAGRSNKTRIKNWKNGKRKGGPEIGSTY